MSDHEHSNNKDSLSLWGAVSMGTGVMIGAGIFALTGQIAELAGTWFPFAFLVAAIIAGLAHTVTSKWRRNTLPQGVSPCS